MFEIFGCPMHFGLSNPENSMAIDALTKRFKDLKIKLVPEHGVAEQADSRLKNIESVIATCNDIAAAASEIIGRGNRPLFIGGDHSSALGTVSASSEGRPDMGLIWIDAHTDINTGDTTLTGNIHGMPTAALIGEGDDRLCRIFNGVCPKIKKENLLFFGVRDMDSPEAEAVSRLGIRVYTYSEIASRGYRVCLDEAVARLSACPQLHVSFDLDAADPKIIKGVSVPVESGLTREEIACLFTELFSRCNVVSADIMEYNPARDTDGETGAFVKQLVDLVVSQN